tara:strand:+ start:289 stop:486 length:198 start_codon:yes stop_codon:yes gene_type:complete
MRYCVEVFCNDVKVLDSCEFKTLKEIAEKLDLSYNQIIDHYEGRLKGKYKSRIMPKIIITKINED